MKKIFMDHNVRDAAEMRINHVFDISRRVCISFSGGKDSTTLFHLVADIAQEKGRKFSVLFIDWEVQYSSTISHIEKMRKIYKPFIEHFYWVALPLTTVNGVSQKQPEWISWAKGCEWVRQPPSHAITDEKFFDFYSYGMTFEDFMPAFSRWFALSETNLRPAVMLIGIRTDESLNRLRSITSRQKRRLAPDMPWTTVFAGNYCHAYPLYDWKVSDIWLYYSLSEKIINPIYELMFKAGVPLKKMRICEPFGPEQRHGLWLYHVLEPETWSRACFRVKGAVSAASYTHENPSYFGTGKIQKPPQMTWHEYAFFLLDSMPRCTAEHYRNKLAVYLRWYQVRDYPEGIPDQQEKDTGNKDIPSWRRVCKCLLKNDYWCRMLSFSPTRLSAYELYCKRMKARRKEWGNI